MMEFDFDLENPLAGADEEVQKLSTAILVGCAGDPEEPPTLFAAESDHMSSLAGADLDQLSARCHALSIIFQAQFCCNLDPALAYLAVNYVDRFLAKREIPVIHSSIQPPIDRRLIDFFMTQSEKTWIPRLLAISCLSLASKMKNIDFSPADFQGDQGGFIFDVETIRRTELIVLNALEWRMRSITPFSFLRFFLSFFPAANPLLLKALKAHASQILFKSQNVVKSLEFRPSLIAAAALLAAARERSPAHFLPFRSALLSCEYIDKQTMTECCSAMDGYDLMNHGMEAASDGWDQGNSTLTPVTVLGHHQHSFESEDIVRSASDSYDATKRGSLLSFGRNATNNKQY